MLRKTVFIFLCLTLPLWAINPYALETGQKYLKLSPDGQWLTYDQAEQPGLYLLNLGTGESVKIADGFGIARFAQWSPNSDFIGLKLFKKVGQTVWQIPCLFDVEHSEIIPLYAPVQKAGVPSIDSQGNVVFTIDHMLYLTDEAGTIKKSFSLPTYANLTPISPDGQRVVFNDDQDQLYFLDLQTGRSKMLTFGGRNYFNPQWNPHNSLLSYQSFDGEIFLFDLSSDREIARFKGESPAWSADGEKLVFVKKQIIETQSVQSSDLFAFDPASLTTLRLTDTPDIFEDFPALSAKGPLYFEQHSGNQTGIYKADIFTAPKGKPNFAALPSEIRIDLTGTIKSPSFESLPNTLMKSAAYSFEIPYVHQCFDSPTWFNGCSACGGTAATMCIAYYNILPKRARKVYDPFYHTTYYGDYIAEKYTYNGFTFDIWAYDRDGVKGYGAFGFIVRHGSEAWSDTKGFMAEFARKHGLYSYVDWSPTREKLMTEANAKRPFVLLNSITNAGHYISVIGYDHNGTTVIVNDPAGDKSLGHYGANYEGKGAKYDWPGYSNGHPNLNTVWCYIYFRDKCTDLKSAIVSAPDTLQLDSTFTLQGFVTNNGNLASDSTNAYVFISKNQSFEAGADWILDTLHIPAIAPKDTFNFNLTSIPKDSIVSAYFYLGVYVRSPKRDVEASFNNNTTAQKIAFKGYPIIYSVQPLGEITDRQPTIRGSFIDFFSPIKFDQIKMYVDSIDVLSALQLTNSSASYVPSADLAPGTHQVELRITNATGLQSVRQWEFTVTDATTIAGNRNHLPRHLQISSNYPNPFNNRTRFDFSIPKAEWVKAELFTIRGQKVQTLISTNLPAGRHQLQIDGTSLASGIYLLRLQAGREIKVKRMLLVK